MTKDEIERILLAPQTAREFLSQAPTQPPDSAPGPRRGIRPVVGSPFAAKATPEEIRATDLVHTTRQALLGDIGRFIPALAGKNPQEALTWLTQRYRDDPTTDNEFLVEDAINRLTHAGEVDERSTRLVAKAIETLTSVPLMSQKNAPNKDSIWSRLFEHSDFRGRSMFAYLGPSSIYSSVRKTSLQNVDLHDRISSLWLDASTGELRGDVYLFQDDRFFGRFTGIRTTAGNPTQRVDVSYIGNHVNDRASSLLLVRRSGGEEVSPIGTPTSRLVISNVIAGVKKVKRLRGDPIFTWDMWPTGGDDHPNDPEKRFIQVRIPVEIEVNNWFNYDAEIWLWFYLYVGDFRLRGYLAYYGAWVESGLISGSVLDGIMEALPDHFGAIDALLQAQLSQINAGGRSLSVYLLPGDQSSFAGPALEGHTSDNVSVALLRMMRPEVVVEAVVTRV